jgi:hypothetical protein
MFNSKSTLNEDFTNLISAQTQLIELYRQSNKDQETLIKELKSLVSFQKNQISDLEQRLSKVKEKQ